MLLKWTHPNDKQILSRHEILNWIVEVIQEVVTTSTLVSHCSCPFRSCLCIAMPSTRLDLLDQAMEKALIEARNSFSKANAIQECYGDDSSIFGGNAVLEQVVDGMLDKIHTKVKEDMNKKLEKYGIEGKLLVVEALINRFQKEEFVAMEKETTDKETTMEALEQAKLPTGLTAEMIISFRAFNVLKEQRIHLEQEVARVNLEIQVLEALFLQGETTVQNQIQGIEQKSREMERTADLCSILS